MTKQLLEKMEDTQLQAGSKAYASALTLYNLFGAAADAGLGGTNAIVSLLKQRFADQRGATIPAVNPNYYFLNPTTAKCFLYPEGIFLFLYQNSSLSPSHKNSMFFCYYFDFF